MFTLRACLRHGGGGSCGARILSRSSTPSARKILLTHGNPSSPMVVRCAPPSSATVVDVRSLSSTSGGGKDGDGDDFFLGDEGSLPAPPSYVRDPVTGKWTNQTHAEISVKDKRLLRLDDDTRGDELMERVAGRWKEAAGAAAGKDNDGLGNLNEEHERVARRIQEEKLAMGTIGRRPTTTPKKGDDDDADEEEPLTPREYRALKTYAEKEHGVKPADFDRLADDDPELIPHHTLSSGADGAADAKQFFDADLDLAYLNPRLNRRAHKGAGSEDEDPFADLLPTDLNPARKVNRRHAKPLPKRLLHHNNLSLLRRYTTPGGKIMNRVQSRLGAKDQRKIAKLVKRARMLGLIPHLGQWKFEDHGYLYEPGLMEAAEEDAVGAEVEGKRDWELELEQRGLWPLQDEVELVKRYYDMGKMLDHIAGPRAGEGEKQNKKREELERLLGGYGELVVEEKWRKEEREAAAEGVARVEE